MTKEELKHLTSDCEYFLNGRGEINLHNFVENLRTTYIEPKEKRIEELEMTVGTLRNFSNEQATCIEKLETQIEKMKCCSICKHYSMSFLPYWCTKNNTAPHCTSKCDKWEIKEND